MADATEEAKREAQAGAADDKFSKLVEALGGTASAQTVFGAPVERDGVTVVPVARVRYGVGGARGLGRKKHDVGGGDHVGYGQGGGVQVAPVGYIELRDGGVSYRRIDDPVRPMPVLLPFPLVGEISLGIMALVSGRVAKSLPGTPPRSSHFPPPVLRMRP